jgi:hypothetical protein
MHAEHKEWEAEIAFWHNECIFFSNVLLKMLEQTTDQDEIDQIENFKSRLDNLNEQLSTVHRGIAAHEQALNDVLNNEGLTETALQHEQTLWQVKDFYKDFRELKNDFYKFADKDCKY